MSGFIRELYYGNIDPQARGIRKGSLLQKASELLSKNEALLTEKFTGEEKKLFQEYMQAQADMLSICQADSFTVGFRLGAQRTYDTFVSTETPLYDFLNDGE